MNNRSNQSWSIPPTLIFSLAFLSGTPVEAQTETNRSAEEPAGYSLLANLIQKIEPDGIGIPDRVPMYIRFFQRELINDVRLFAFSVTPRWRDDGILELTGFVEFQENRDMMARFLKQLGFDRVENQIEVLPSKELKDQLYGFIATTHCFCFDRPTGDKEVVTDCLLGEPVYLLKEAKNGFFLCHTVEGYTGYVDGKRIRRVDASEFSQYQTGPQIDMTQDFQQTNGPRIPIGSRIKWIKNGPNGVVAKLPQGDEILVPSDQCVIQDGNPNPSIERILENAHRLLGTKYLWGGKTSDGMDCSGLVQVAFATEGIQLPRDSNQQIYLGKLTATRWYRQQMRRGDTLYFLGNTGKITHTGIYLGEGKYLESADPGVQVTSLDPSDTNYNARRSASFAYAKRLME
ncbi:MAG: C40 family peptidase [Pirellulales bacterium]|nr:C40 family peptidase [Pirellulales bacterium]